VEWLKLVAAGMITWALALSALISVIVLCDRYIGPGGDMSPLGRAKYFAYAGGGGAALILVVLIGLVFFAIVMNASVK